MTDPLSLSYSPPLVAFQSFRDDQVTDKDRLFTIGKGTKAMRPHISYEASSREV